MKSIIYLITGGLISILSLVGCKEKEVEPVQSATYVYENTFSDPIEFTLSNDVSNKTFTIPSKTSIKLLYRGSPGAYPFQGDGNVQEANKVTVKFPNNKCISYNLDRSTGTLGGSGVFDLKEYKNYSIKTVQESKYELTYSIDNEDLDRAITCQ